MPGYPALRQRPLHPATVDRLARYHRLCIQLKAEGQRMISSRDMSERLNAPPSVIRKDLSRLGKLGARGHGYRIDELQRALGAILGKEQAWNVVLVGAGRIGAALLTHGVFERRGFHFAAVFDDDPNKVGEALGGLVVQNVSHLPEVLRSLDAEIGVITVPATAAQRVARLLVTNGVRAILNFAPVDLSLEEDVALANVDVALELEKLCFRLTAAKAVAV